jgi:hypothetical protein
VLGFQKGRNVRPVQGFGEGRDVVFRNGEIHL